MYKFDMSVEPGSDTDADQHRPLGIDQYRPLDIDADQHRPLGIDQHRPLDIDADHARPLGIDQHRPLDIDADQQGARAPITEGQEGVITRSKAKELAKIALASTMDKEVSPRSYFNIFTATT
ncbi:unnamed protein product [Cochlearia groenlandica]